ncbi:indolepyruvate ferredoxin oxidoreductase [Komagataeibacter xylinus]|uniref:Indolepyruvate ferredoxin oxidoreductase n=1 Tax=Komagataeibacter xylinus TaxID=28448 RepID=A0A318Q1S5_KOMXY|nr:indolepyruvate ferredoxin oxidoreductase subunit alpha [Komagataeibacter xylinus]PYD56745.1 indolepyruvate ferredoxin oxidoreductase [Komagataeibacter xylinus]GBQ74090.1 indolepyruvate ferredoxin oxidoreductase [Komagataeibacter xylinus NBRC 15237]
MAERSFAHEVKQLRIGAGEVFRGEGILAITKALLQSGVGYVAGYQGAPISHLMDVLADAQDLLAELDVHFESSASEASAAATLAASVMYPIRGAVTWKSTAGTNVASDALANLSSGGVKGGALIIIGEDYGEGSSIMQERSHAFAMKSQMWLLDPRPSLPCIVDMVEKGFQLSEASNTPVMLQVRIRSCHMHGSFVARENRRPAMTLNEASLAPRRDPARIVLPPAAYRQEHEKLEQRWPAAVAYVKAAGLNEFLGATEGDVGLIVLGGLYNNTLRALMRLGLADLYGESVLPLYVMNVAYPVIDDEVLEFCRDKKSVLVIEEGQPDYIEQAIGRLLHRHVPGCMLHGKDMLPKGGEYTVETLTEGLRGLIACAAPDLIDNAARAPNEMAITDEPKIAALARTVPARPAGFCTGCPERPIFAAMKLVEGELGPHHIASDIGCHLFSILPPFNLGATTMGYGLAPASASAFNGLGSGKPRKRTIAVMGDGGFWHNGLTSGIGNAVFNKSDDVIVIVDNYYSAATGGQDIPSSRSSPPTRSTHHPISRAIEGVGVEWVREVDHTYDVTRMRDVLREALTTRKAGPKVIVASSECMLNRQRREKPLRRKALGAGQRVVNQRFGVDEEICTGDHECIRLSGCPSLSVRPSADPLKEDPVASIDQSCVACGNCGEVADAAVLCPSFYRADTVVNAGWRERWRQRLRTRAVGVLQRWRESRRPVLG